MLTAYLHKLFLAFPSGPEIAVLVTFFLGPQSQGWGDDGFSLVFGAAGGSRWTGSRRW